MSAALRGEGLAREELLVRLQCVPRFLRVIALRSGRALSRELLEDLVQDVLAVVWRKLPDFRGEARLETWLFRVTDLTARNSFRFLDRRRGPSLEDLPEGAEPAAAAATNDGDLEALASALQELAPADRQLLSLKHFDELTFDAIGTKLDTSVNTVKTRYYRALSSLRRLLGLGDRGREDRS